MTSTARDRVLEAAPVQFARQGYAATPLWEIAEMAGCTTAALHHHFPTKEALLVAVGQPFLDDVGQDLDHHERNAGPTGGRDLLLQSYVRTLMRHRSVAKVLIHDTTTRITETGEQVREQQRRIVSLLAGPRPTMRQLVRAHCAITILHLMVGDLANVPAHRLHRPLVDAATELLGGDGDDRPPHRWSEHEEREPSDGPLV